MIKAVRGTRDLLPPDTELWNFVERKVREVFARYNYHEIRTPVFESTELFARGVGEETDIVSKEMFTWEDGERFSKAKLREAWLRENKDRVFIDEMDQVLVAGFAPIDLAVYPTDGSRVDRPLIELISLRPQATEADVSALIDASKRLVTERGGMLALKAPLLRIVTPAGARSVNSTEVEITQLAGHFFESVQPLTLRPENTAGVVRAYIEHEMGRSGLLQKLYYIGPQFRRERPQKGRYRQFYQIGAEVIGPPSAGSELPIRDAEVLDMLIALLDAVGLKGWTLYLNSVGCVHCRPAYNQALREALAGVKDQMCGDCQRRAETNPLRVLDCKVPADQPIIEKLPKIADYLDEGCREHFARVRAILDTLAVPYQVNERMVRGLDYYTRTTFEFTHGELGSQSAVLGGGRYDGLSEQIGGPKAPGIGFAIGEDRLVLALQAQLQEAVEPLKAFVIPLGAGMNRHALKLAKDLRVEGVTVDVSDESFRLKKSFETAEKLGATFAIIVGENEVKADAFAVKHLKSGEQTTISRAELLGYLEA
jgi:histidyl-tRNA synthetase